MKRLISLSIIIIVMVTLCVGIFSNAADISNDPADTYTPQKAEYEDRDISLWFEHSFKKVMTSDTTHSGRNSYSVYMAKNEIENAQFILYSGVLKEDLKANVTAFTDENGNEIQADIYYQMYLTLTDLSTTSLLGGTEENTFIRNGEQPDPVIKLRKSNSFTLNAGKSQAFYIRLTSTEDTPSGWYSAQLNITDSEGQVIKTATVYAYVWDFVISEKTELKTAFFMENQTDYGGSYKAFYDYLLENRLCAMDVPGELNSSNPYVTNDRVAAIRVSSVGGGNNKVYKDDPACFPEYKAMYDDFAAMAEWEEIEDKFYFYTVDEAVSKDMEEQYALIHPRDFPTIDDAKDVSERLDRYWPDAEKVIPYHLNHPYPYTVMDPIASIEDKAIIWDGLQEMMDSGCSTIFCPMIYGFTPLSELEAAGFAGTGNKLYSLSGRASGKIGAGETYFSWETLLGDYSDRVQSFLLVNEEGEEKMANNWAYCAGWCQSYSYCNHMIENTGLQTRLLFWQLYQENVKGYLYYGANYWDEYNENNGYYVDKTVTGSKTGLTWKVNKRCYDTGYSTYGDGTLFYGPKMAKVIGFDVVGSIRVDMLRDGVEDYQMFTMLEELCGSDAADKLVDSVSNNVVDYISMPQYDRSAWDPSMDEYDIMASVRKELGDAVEKATNDRCEHQWDEGVITVEATCLKMGEKVYTCSLCNMTDTEQLPTLHAVGECFDIIRQVEPTCEADGLDRHQCRICGYAKNYTVPSYHTDPESLIYEYSTVSEHSVTCSVCNEYLGPEVHVYFSYYTDSCTEDGIRYEECKYCKNRIDYEEVTARGHNYDTVTVDAGCEKEGYIETVCLTCGESSTEVIAPKGHSYVEGVCSLCGDIDETYSPEPLYTAGDINNDGSINVQDIFRMKLMIKTLIEPTELERLAADINGDGLVNAADTFKLTYRVLNGQWV